MQLSDVHLKGFRNFKDCRVFFAPKTLVIGANDVGKSNLLHALRLLLDKTLSEADLSPVDNDFYAYEPTNELSVTLHFINIRMDNAECIISCFKGDIKNEELFIQYKATRNSNGAIDYQIFTGYDQSKLNKREGRFYIRSLNLEYISSYRDLKKYIKREQKEILEEAKLVRTTAEEDLDLQNFKRLGKSLNLISQRINKFNFIKSATQNFNSELKKLSAENENREIAFDAGVADVDEFLNDLLLVSKKHGKSLTVGGDGRNNQIFMSMWAGRKQKNDSMVTIHAVEEPEAHLHPHHQRKLASYLANGSSGQIIITSHSPHITTEFNPSSIVRLFVKDMESTVAQGGVSPIIDKAIMDFAHRMNVIPAEAFFSDVVFLVEGVSEVIFFKALAKAVNLDLDYYNISILSVEGVGYRAYVDLFTLLGIPFCFRTDNDCSKVPHKDYYRNAGLYRLMDIAKGFDTLIGGDIVTLQTSFDKVYYQKQNTPNSDAVNFMASNQNVFSQNGLFLSDCDLETDLANSVLNSELLKFTGRATTQDAISVLQGSKGETMFAFVKAHESDLKKLIGSKFELPIKFCIQKTR